MKAIMFDFDGTLSAKSPNAWGRIWELAGFTDEERLDKKYMKMFFNGEITYEQWTDLSFFHFKSKQMNKDILKQIAEETKLIDGAEETFKKLKEQGYSLNILSGGVKQVIEMALGDNLKYFDNICANDFHFDENGIINGITSTKYDNEGKGVFISEFAKKYGVDPQNIWFVGNSRNDEWAYLSGCKTLCINPEKVDLMNRKKWNYVLLKVENLQEILPVLDEKNKSFIIENIK